MPARSATHAGGIVYRLRGGQREFLVVTASRNREHWVLPKGHVEPGEAVEVAAVREVLEESGVSARIEKSLGVQELELGDDEQRIHYYLMRSEKEGGPREPNRMLAWLSAKDAARRLSFPQSRQVLEAALRELGPSSEEKS